MKPSEILWRRKDGFSDGVSGTKKWFEYIQEFVEKEITDEEFNSVEKLYPSKEAYYYRKIYNEQFPTYQPLYDYWMPKWIETNGDPSGRLLQIFEQK